MKMRIFVTGGAGFIGRHLVKALIKQNHEITIYDNFSNSSKENLKKFPFNKSKVITGDIRNLDDVSKNSIDNDIVIHLAAKISVNESIQNPQETFETNVDGTENVLKACHVNKIKKIFALSSAAVYGNNILNHVSIESENIHPISPYGKSKQKMEEKIINFSKNYDFDSKIFRLFNVYGEGQSPEYAGVISKFVECSKKKLPLTIFGDGKQTRDFVAIEDVVNLFVKVISLDSKKNGEIYNVASGKYTSILELANLIKKLSNKELEIKFEKKRIGEIDHSTASIKKAKEELDYEPKIELSQGIRKFLI
ncbi:NAD-dependent epimerase/dehydratase [Candidatus Nitrosopumilus koreensis AR1]|uniref:NAD-dependent epimerase/dehydratase n=1 Tax=Candidatus Nitrosopumilus koreensis AR1 TaxID=1229908 RepID=K0B3I9_9ARCH|nr:MULTISPECIES: NAD-dependent epimerase/dehydratase family protein [Nitrosopumilus]AFS80029.1 NAD-dependent epimerase/dehydratase [Candidatus Nitrosopumilus koreensis AR1]